LSSLLLFFLYFSPSPPPSTLFPYTTLFRSSRRKRSAHRPRIRQVWCSSWFLVSVGPYDRHPGRALGHLLRRLRVSHDRRQIAFQLGLGLQHPLRGVKLLGRDLLPARVGRRDHEVTILRLGDGPYLDRSGRAVEQVHDHTARLGKVLVRLSLDRPDDRPLPALRHRLLDALASHLVLVVLHPP